MSRVWFALPFLLVGALFGPHLADYATTAATAPPAYAWRPVADTFGTLPFPAVWTTIGLHVAIVGLLLGLAHRDGLSPRGAALLVTAWAAWPPLVDGVAAGSHVDLLVAAAFVLVAWGAATSPLPAWSRAVVVFGAGLAASLAHEAALGVLLALPLATAARRAGPLPVLIGAFAAVLLQGALHARVTPALPPVPALGAVWAWADLCGWPLHLGIAAGTVHVGLPTGPTMAAGAGLLLLGLSFVPAPLRAPALVWAVGVAPAAVGFVLEQHADWAAVYLPAAATSAALGGALAHFRADRAVVGVLVAALAIGAWAPRAEARAHAWASPRALAEDELTAEPTNPVAMVLAGRLRVAAGDAGGLTLWRDGLSRAPEGLIDAQSERYQLATAAWRLDRPAEARAALDAFLGGAGVPTGGDRRAAIGAWAAAADPSDPLPTAVLRLDAAIGAASTSRFTPQDPGARLPEP